MIDEDVSIFLEHFGMKGMHWGVRKAATSGSVLTKTERTAARTNMKAEARKKAGERRMEALFQKRGLGITPYSELSTQSRTIAKGSEFFRTSKRAEEKFTNITFVSNNPDDRTRYKAIMSLGAFGLPGKKNYKPTYEHVYKTTVKLKLPSEKARMDAFAELMDTPIITVGKKELTGKEYLKRIGYGREVKRLDSLELGRKHFQSMHNTAWADTPISSGYFKVLSKKGYNAVADDNDRKIISDDPIILLNPNGSLKQMSVKQLTNKEINKAQIDFKGDLKD